MDFLEKKSTLVVNNMGYGQDGNFKSKANHLVTL